MKADQALLLEKEGFETIDARCRYFGKCGGCSLQDLSYQDQLVLKRQRALRAFAPFDPTLPIEMVPCEDPWRYRNKAELTFGELDGRILLGYHAKRSFWKIVDLEDCLLVPEAMARVMNRTRELAQASGLPAYRQRPHQGFFRFLLLRASHATGQLLVCLQTTPGHRDAVEKICAALAAEFPEIDSLYWGINAKISDIAVPDELVLLHGQPYLADRIGPFSVRLHPMNFLQPNPVQAARMYAELQRQVNGRPSGTAWDLYCGMGLIGFHVAGLFKTVYGIDIEPRNLELAHLNAQDNGIANMQFHTGKAEDLLADKRFWLQEAKPDLIVVDPPRAGLHESVISTMLSARPKQIGYFSCNVQALARDLEPLTTGFPRYRIASAKAFDLFPHTAHFEVLTVLERQD